MKLETWVSLAALGLSVMFVALLISFYNFLIGPEGEGPERVVDPGGLLIQLISISAAPCLILAGFTFGLAKSYGTKPGGMLIIVAGAVMIAGMVAASSLLPRIQDQYIVSGLDIIPYVFMAGGAGLIGVGGYLLAASKRKYARNLDDLR